jgi:hypothetical protein
LSSKTNNMNLIVIDVKGGDCLIGEVKNFSDENVKNGINKLLGIPVNKLQCQSSSMTYSIYESEIDLKILNEEPLRILRNNCFGVKYSKLNLVD